MNYNSICESGGDVADRFSMQLFADKYIGADGQSKVNQQQVFLNHLKISHLPGKEILIKIYERMKPVYSSSKIHMKDEVTLNIEGGLGLRGDVLLKCFTINKESSDKQKERSLLFQCQFNTCAIDFNEVNNLLRFYKEELDFVFMDQSVNNQAYIEFGFNFEHSREGSLRRRKQSFSEFSRADSYENFDRAEDHDRSITVDPLYSEINKTPAITNLPLQSTSVGGLANNSIALPSPIDGTDSGIGSDSPKNMTNAPKVPPKPSKAYYPESNGYASNEDAQRSSAIPEENHTTREHSVLPAGLRKISSRPSSPATTINEYTPNTNGSVVNLSAGRQTPSFEPDLVGKDRYDKNSKCFSYVPAKALNEHFTLPKKAPSMRRLSIERSDLDVPDTCELKEKLKTMNLKGADIQRRCETPKWDFEIDALTNSNGGFEADTCKRSTSTVPRSHSPHDFNDLMRLATPVNVPSSPIQQYSRDNKRPTEHILASLRSNGYNEDTLKSNRYNTPEIPVVQDQARRAVHTSTPNSKYFNSTKPASNNYEDTSQSEMEELCDPDYYLTYSAKTPKSAPPVSISNNGRGNTFDYSRMNKGASQRDLDDMNSLVDSATLPTQRSCTTPKPIPSWKMSTMKADTPDYSQQHKDDFRYRNCKSVAASPISSTRKLFSNDRYDATTDATDPDHWLGSKLKQLQSKRQSQPDLTTRRKTEKMLLAELKKSNTDEGRGANESNYTSEGQGKRPSDYRDPLNDYMYEEERLKNTKSPFTYDDFSSMRSNYNTPTNYLYNDSSNYGSRPASRAARPTSSLGQRSVPRGKPPTPPPGRDFRDRSRSPAKSPATVKQRFSAAPPEMQSQYQVERNKISGHQKQSSNSYHKPIDYSSDESDNSQGGDDNEFSHLRSIVETNVSRPTSRTAQPYSVRSNTSTPFVADYQNNNTNIYSPSPIPAKRYVNRLPLEEAFSNNSILADSVQGQRSETPAFPIVRDTPLPFHPLLYNGAGTSPSRVNSSLGQSENRNMTSLNYR
uniref:C2 tensin-type domain-containing protein n=1 Tax=Rhabditophanes sp. KR3021 TaxID=114890 RepID=A0AC35TMP4_9BILA